MVGERRRYHEHPPKRPRPEAAPMGRFGPAPLATLRPSLPHLWGREGWHHHKGVFGECRDRLGGTFLRRRDGELGRTAMGALIYDASIKFPRARSGEEAFKARVYNESRIYEWRDQSRIGDR